MHVVTGATEGIGRAVAVALASRDQLVLAAARTAEALEELAREHPGIVPLPVDLTTEPGRWLLSAAIDTPVETLVHAAGSRVPVVPYAAIDPDRLVEDFRIHVAATVALTGLLLEEHDLQRVVVLDSYSATTPRVGWAAYSIVKAAAQMMAAALEEEHPQVAVLRLFPGAVRTGLLHTVLEAGPSPARDTYRAMEEAGEVAEPDEIGEWVADVLTDGVAGSRTLHYRR